MPAGARYHKVFTRLWTSPEFRSWTEDGRAACQYLLTCPERSTEGLFRLPVPLAAFELQWPAERVETAFDELERAGFIARDRAADMVLLVNAVAWNAPAGPKQIRGAINVLAELPATNLRALYLQRCKSVCPQLADAIIQHLGWSETVSEQYPSTTDTQSIPPALTPSPTPAPEPPPPTHALDTVSLDPDGPEVVAVADSLIAKLGYVDPPPAGPDERRYVARAIGRGWTIEQLTDLAVEAASRVDVEDPRSWLRGALKRCANEDPAKPPPPATTASAVGPALDTWSAQWSLLTTRGPAGGANEAAKQAWFDTRKTRKFDTETNAKFAFRDAYLARSATPAEASA